jgi:hypothetical protein
MPFSALDPVSAAALVAAAAYLMATAGFGKHLLRRRITTCTVCHRPGHLCTCRWL